MDKMGFFAAAIWVISSFQFIPDFPILNHHSCQRNLSLKPVKQLNSQRLQLQSKVKLFHANL